MKLRSLALVLGVILGVTLPATASAATPPGTAELTIVWRHHAVSPVTASFFDIFLSPVGQSVAYIPNGGIQTNTYQPQRLSVVQRSHTVVAITCEVTGIGGSSYVAIPASSIVIVDIKANDSVVCRFDTVAGPAKAPPSVSPFAPANPYPYYVPGGNIGYAAQ